LRQLLAFLVSTRRDIHSAPATVLQYRGEYPIVGYDNTECALIATSGIPLQLQIPTTIERAVASLAKRRGRSVDELAEEAVCWFIAWCSQDYAIAYRSPSEGNHQTLQLHTALHGWMSELAKRNDVSLPDAVYTALLCFLQAKTVVTNRIH